MYTNVLYIYWWPILTDILYSLMSYIYTHTRALTTYTVYNIYRQKKSLRLVWFTSVLSPFSCDSGATIVRVINIHSNTLQETSVREQKGARGVRKRVREREREEREREIERTTSDWTVAFPIIYIISCNIHAHSCAFCSLSLSITLTHSLSRSLSRSHSLALSLVLSRSASHRMGFSERTQEK